MSGPTRRRLPRAVRERQMLDAAVAVFSRRGYHPAAMDEIAETAGVSKPMFYAYLGSKQELFLACIRREADRLAEAVATAVHAELAPDERLHRGLVAFFEFVTGNRDGWVVLYRQARVLGGAFAEQVNAVRERIVVVVARLLAGPATEDGRLDRAMPLAYALVGAAESLADWGVERDAQPHALASRLMDFAWTGLAGLARGQHWR